MRTFYKNIAIAACLGFICMPFADSTAGNKGGGSSSNTSGSSSHNSGSSSHNSGSSNHTSPSHNSGGSGYNKPNSSTSPSSNHSTSPNNSGSHNTPNTPSNNGYTKPAPANTPAAAPHTIPITPTTTHSQPPTSSQGYSKPQLPNTPSDVHSPTKSSNIPSTALGSASNKSMSADSYKAYQAERNQATKPPQPVHSTDIKNNPARSTYQNADQYMNKRTTIVNNYNNTYPGWGSMGNGMYPNYGMWSNSFLTGMVMGYVGTSLLSNSMWMYSHMHEPWYPSYRADLEAQAANNAELRSRLAAMDVEIAKLKSQNAEPVQQNTLPDNVDPALAISPEVMIAGDEHTNGMSWWYAVWFFVVGLGSAFLVIKLFR